MEEEWIGKSPQRFRGGKLCPGPLPRPQDPPGLIGPTSAGLQRMKGRRHFPSVSNQIIQQRLCFRKVDDPNPSFAKTLPIQHDRAQMNIVTSDPTRRALRLSMRPFAKLANSPVKRRAVRTVTSVNRVSWVTREKESAFSEAVAAVRALNDWEKSNCYQNSQMGNCNFKSDSYDPTVALSRQQFQFHHPIGKGGFGKVWKVTHKKTKQVFAMKQMLKARIVAKRSVHSVTNERKLLTVIKHPFIVNMTYAFQDRQNLYLAMDIMTGGDLRYHIGRQKRFSESQTKFFAGCMILALEYLHSNRILHRDIKPENLVLDQSGYLHVTDFGIARVYQEQNSNETSGTPGYMAPEVLCRMNHSSAVDYFALGVIVYEFMTGRRPYLGRNRKEIRDAVLAKQIQLSRNEIPAGWSIQAVDFTNKLIQRKPQNRLGFSGAEEVKGHSWFRGFDWSGLINQSLQAPFVPLKTDNFDVRQVMNEWRDQEALAKVKESQITGVFNGYFYDFNLATPSPATQSSILEISKQQLK